MDSSLDWTMLPAWGVCAHGRGWPETQLQGQAGSGFTVQELQSTRAFPQHLSNQCKHRSKCSLESWRILELQNTFYVSRNTSDDGSICSTVF